MAEYLHINIHDDEVKRRRELNKYLQKLGFKLSEKNVSSLSEISVSLDAGNEKVFAIGEKIHEIDNDAYMSGYNWERLFDYYFEKNEPELLEGIDYNTEAETFVARYFIKTEETVKKINRIAEIIRYFIENEEELYKIVKTAKIEWD